LSVGALGDVDLAEPGQGADLRPTPEGADHPVPVAPEQLFGEVPAVDVEARAGELVAQATVL